MRKQTAGLGIIAALAVVFLIADVPAWAWAFPALLLVIQVAIIVRERAIDARQ